MTLKIHSSPTLVVADLPLLLQNQRSRDDDAYLMLISYMKVIYIMLLNCKYSNTK